MRFARYVLVQLLAYGLDMGGFLLLFALWGINPLLANVVAKLLAGLFAFVAHRRFTFAVAGTAEPLGQALRYCALLALNIPLSALLLAALLWVIPMAVVAKFAADVLGVLLTYWLSQRFVFLGASPSETGPSDAAVAETSAPETSAPEETVGRSEGRP